MICSNHKEDLYITHDSKTASNTPTFTILFTGNLAYLRTSAIVAARKIECEDGAVGLSTR